MKTSIKALFASTLTALFLTSSAFTTFAKEKVSTAKAPAANYNKVVVTGTANVILVQKDVEGINAPDNYDETQTTAKQKGYTLYINSTEKDPATVYVYVKDLQRIEASDNATVKTSGDFDLKVLQIILKDDAKANVKAKVGSLYTNVKDKSDLKLSGSTEEHHVEK